jgi:hypothetical protein
MQRAGSVTRSDFNNDARPFVVAEAFQTWLMVKTRLIWRIGTLQRIDFGGWVISTIT